MLVSLQAVQTFNFTLASNLIMIKSLKYVYSFNSTIKELKLRVLHQVWKTTKQKQQKHCYVNVLLILYTILDV